MESKCSIFRLGISRDSYGGTLQQAIESITPFAKNLPCSYDESGAGAKRIYGQRNTITSSTLYFAVDPHTEVSDVIILTNLRTKETILLDVEGESQPVPRGRLWTVSVQRIREPQ